MDRNIYIYDLPISIECEDCSDVMDYIYSHKTGLRPKPFSYEAPEDQSVVTTVIGSSATLPITEELYMKIGFMKQPYPGKVLMVFGKSIM